MRYLKLGDITAYKISFELSNFVWNLVSSWKYLPQTTVGIQFVRAVDSISANIAEGFGRYHKKDKIKFYYNSRASVYESLDWLQKAKVRKIVSENEYQNILPTLKQLPKEINSLIKWTETHLSI